MAPPQKSGEPISQLSTKIFKRISILFLVYAVEEIRSIVDALFLVELAEVLQTASKVLKVLRSDSPTRLGCSCQAWQHLLLYAMEGRNILSPQVSLYTLDTAILVWLQALIRVEAISLTKCEDTLLEHQALLIAEWTQSLIVVHIAVVLRCEDYIVAE